MPIALRFGHPLRRSTNQIRRTVRMWKETLRVGSATVFLLVNTDSEKDFRIPFRRVQRTWGPALRFTHIFHIDSAMGRVARRVKQFCAD